MPASTRYPGRTAADILKARGIERVVYFHSDHFEPWRFVPGRPTDYALSLGDVEAYLAGSERDWARRATLFYKENVNYLVDPSRALWRGHPADPLGFIPPAAEQEALSATILGTLSGAGRPLQVHIHHENITWNDRIRDERVRAHLEDPRHRMLDDARFELLVQLNLRMLAGHGVDPQAWFFVHGHWALNASDPHECTIVREIEILRRNGCLGDFTQPSGRPHTDSRIDEPYLAKPIALAKGYDRPEALPIAAAGAGAVPADRFLIWASQIGHRHCSIDHYSGFVRERMADPTLFARANAELGWAHDGVLYVKTHAHSLHPIYWQAEDGAGAFPHAHPGIVAELGALFDAADQAGAAIEFATVAEVFARVMTARRAPERDLVEDHRLEVGDPMAAVGCDVHHCSLAQGEAAAPPLDALRAIADPAIATGDPVPEHAWPIVRLHAAADPEPLPGERVMLPSGGGEAEAAVALLAERVIAARQAVLAETSEAPMPAPVGVERLGALLDAIGADREAPVVVIGCGNGTSVVALAASGWRAIGIDHAEAKLRTARAIAAEAEAEGLVAATSGFHATRFPQWADAPPLDHATAIVVGLENEGGMSGQAAFIRGLAQFRFAIVDLSRFFVPREPGAEQARLVELFAQAGFEPPRVATLPGGDLAVFRHGRPRGLKGWAGKVLRTLGLSEAA